MWKKLANAFLRGYRTWDSISTFPVGYWNEINETGDTSFMFINPNRHGRIQRKWAKRIADDAWKSIQIQIVDKYGFSPDHKDLLEATRKAAILRIRAFTEGKLYLIDQAEIEELKMAKMVKSGNSPNFTLSVAGIEREIGFAIDIWSFPLDKFLQHVKLANARRRHERQNNRKTGS